MLGSLILGERPKCSSNDVFVVSKHTVKLRTHNGFSELHGVLIHLLTLLWAGFFNDWIVIATNHVLVCKLAAP